MTAVTSSAMKDYVISAAPVLVLGLLMLSGDSFAQEAKYPTSAKVYKLDLSYEKLFHNSDPMVPDIQHRDWGDAVNLDVGVKSWRWYVDLNPHFESAYGKVSTVGLFFKTGFEVFSWLDLNYTHHSRHSADRTNSSFKDDGRPSTSPSGYPLYDSMGIVIHFVGNGRK